MKLIDVLVMISKGELKEDYRTEIKINGVYYKLFSQETAENLFSELFNHLNDECILIRYEGKNTEKIKELDNYEWQEGDYDYQIEILYRKLNEVIRYINKEE